VNPAGPAEPGSCPAEALAAGYEDLRRQAVAGRDGPWGLGEALLRSRGVAAWIRAWAGLLPSAEPRRPSAPRSGGGSPGIGRGEIAAILARMALGAREEV
jgi:hypothetical protein